jgi:hypothetical protein
VVRPRVLEALRNLDDDPVGVRWVDRAQGLGGGLEDVAGLEAAGAAIDVELELDRGEDRLLHVRTDGREDLEQRAAGVSADDREQRLPLLLVGGLVDDRHDVAVALVDPPGPPGGEAPLEPIERDIAEMTLVYPHGANALALTGRRRLVEVTRAARIAVAVLEPGALHRPRISHATLLAAVLPANRS